MNNIYVCARNHGWNAREYIRAIPADRIVQFHLAGHEDCGTHVIDTHNTKVIDEVWELYRRAHQHVGDGGVATLLEWDADIPEFPVLMEEVAKAKHFMGEASGRFSSAPVRRGRGDSFPHPLHTIPAE